MRENEASDDGVMLLRRYFTGYQIRNQDMKCKSEGREWQHETEAALRYGRSAREATESGVPVYIRRSGENIPKKIASVVAAENI